MTRKKAKIEKLGPVVLNRYRVTGYHCGDFVGICDSASVKFATFTVEDPLASSSLAVDSEIEVTIALAKFELVQAEQTTA